MQSTKFTITLPQNIAEQLDHDAQVIKSPRSSLISAYIQEHYRTVEEQDDIQQRAVKYKASLQEVSTMADSQQKVISALQHELDGLKTQQKNLLDQAASQLAVLNDLRRDKEFLQRQLTVMLPAPRQSFWARFRRKKE